MSSQICIDASVALQWILPSPQSQTADSLLQKWDDADIQIISAPLLDIDTTAIIRKLMQMKLLLPQQGEQAFQIYRQMGIDIVSHPALTQTAWDLIGKYDQAHISDLHYLALAELVDADFWTANRHLFSNLKGKNQRAHFLGDYSTATTPAVIPPVVEKNAENHKHTRTDFPGLWRAI
jgi:predicted nucleic acid-binding protein